MEELTIRADEVRVGDEVLMAGRWWEISEVAPFNGSVDIRFRAGGQSYILKNTILTVRRKRGTTPMKHYQEIEVPVKDVQVGDEITLQEGGEWREVRDSSFGTEETLLYLRTPYPPSRPTVGLMKYPKTWSIRVRRERQTMKVLIETVLPGDVVVNLGGLPLGDGLTVNYSGAGHDEGWFLEFETPRPFPAPPFIPRASLPLSTMVEVIR